MATRTNIASKQGTQETDDLLGLDAYSADGQLVGRVAGYVPQTPEDETGIELETVDPQGAPPRVLIDGHGFPVQAEIIIPVSQLQRDARARRVILPLTMEQIRNLPHQERLT